MNNLEKSYLRYILSLPILNAILTTDESKLTEQQQSDLAGWLRNVNTTIPGFRVGTTVATKRCDVTGQVTPCKTLTLIYYTETV